MEIKQNEEHHGIEVYFDSKPDEATRNALKALHFRWHSVKKCWYGRAEESTVRTAIAGQITPPDVNNRLGIKVGDVFTASWGYDQTNVDFFQVVAVSGQSVRVVEVNPEVVEDETVGYLASNITFKLTPEPMPTASHSVFIKDQQKGDLKRLQTYQNDIYFKLKSFANAHHVKHGLYTAYVSSYA